MDSLSSFCGGIEILKLLKFVFMILDIVLFVVPMGLIVMVTVDLAKNVIAGKDDDMRKNVNLAIKRVIFCMALFLLEPVIQTSINMLGDLGVDYATCVKIARETPVEEMDKYYKPIEQMR